MPVTAEDTALEMLQRARTAFPRVPWDNAFPVAPAYGMPIESCAWAITSKGGHNMALVDPAGAMLYTLRQSL